MELIGHRGCAAQYPENTLQAVRESASRLNAVEIDVRRCATGELVAFHDETLERVAGVARPLGETDRETLADLDVLESGEPIPLVSDVLEAIPEDATLQLELKETGLVEDLRELLSAAGVDHRLSSFMPEALAEVRDAGWSVPTGLLFGEDPVENLERARALECAYAHPHWELCLETDVVTRAKDDGFGVLAWNTDSPEIVELVRRAGVDGITTDRWDLGPEPEAELGVSVPATD
ncbi:MAG: glycerophosphodiester phosphodiesterase [Salinigranum sp.]